MGLRVLLVSQEGRTLMYSLESESFECTHGYNGRDRGPKMMRLGDKWVTQGGGEVTATGHAYHRIIRYRYEGQIENAKRITLC